MGEFFPEIKSQQQLVTNVIREEEASFLRTLDQGLQLLENVVAETTGKEVSGAKVFELYDTFGFPKDLTALILKEKGFSYNEEEFEVELQKQKTRSRAASEVSTEDWNVLIPGNVETFVGYDQLENDVKITRIRKVDSKKDGILYQIVLDNTPFYPEGGGQVGDKGTLVSANETIEIIDTKKENNLILHFAKQLPENIEAGFVAKVNNDLRGSTSKNHSATHLMHLALRNILGTHVEQKGSLVNPTYLRFDFSHFSKVSDEELRQVEASVNAQIEAHCNW
jgi:alanyl-tRNA synthetase